MWGEMEITTDAGEGTYRFMIEITHLLLLKILKNNFCCFVRSVEAFATQQTSPYPQPSPHPPTYTPFACNRPHVCPGKRMTSSMSGSGRSAGAYTARCRDRRMASQSSPVRSSAKY